MAIRLSNRLSALASLVSKGHRLADIGTDHGYIPIYLCQTGIIPSAIAMDIGKGPLQQATAHIKQQGLSSRIRTRLSDGLTALQPGEADTILIAGMGGGLVMKILSQGTHALTGSEELILQPQSEIAQVRAYLRTHGFRILEEEMILEDGKYYPMMKGADYIVLESNHDVDILMHTSRPQFLKQRIYGDDGHLNNMDCAQVLNSITDENTKMIILAHISQEANTRQLALDTSCDVLLHQHTGSFNKELVVCAAGQFEMIIKGDKHEKTDTGTVKRFIGMESTVDVSIEQTV